MKRLIIIVAIALSACASIKPTTEQINGLNDAYKRYQHATQNGMMIDCGNKAECDKAFSLVKAFINKNSDMRTQNSDEISISTYAPIPGNWAANYGLVYFSALMTPGKGDTASIELKADCSGLPDELDAVARPENHMQGDPTLSHICMDKLTAIYSGFKPFIEIGME